MPWARMSGLTRVLGCPASTTLPTVIRPSSAEADWGTAVHHWKATGEIACPRSRLMPALRAFLESIDYAAWSQQWYPTEGPGYSTVRSVPTGLVYPRPGHEVGLALSLEEHVETSLDRAALHYGPRADVEAWKASRPEAFVVGTADYVGNLLGLPWVDDLKTGHEDFLPAPKCDQNLGYALALARATGSDEVAVSITHWPRRPKSHSFRRWVEVVTAAELNSFEARLRAAWAKSLERPPTNPGGYCRWCPTDCEYSC